MSSLSLARALLVASALVLAAAGCPPSARACANESDCGANELCVVGADGAGACTPVPVVDAGNTPNDAGVIDEDDAGFPDGGPDDDAGTPVEDAGVADAGVRDDGLRLRGALEVAPGVMRGGTHELRGRVTGTNARTIRGGTFAIDPDLNGATP